jgi:tetratricopeptide (TPR) repeat protein
MDHAKKGDGWSMQPFFAVTVPEHYGYDKYFTLEGLQYRVNRDTLQGERTSPNGPSLDVPATNHALYDVFKYRGLFTADGSWDSTVYKDENATTLSRNYAAAHLQLAYYYHSRGNLPKAIDEMERVGRMFPDFTEVLVPLGGFYMEARDTMKAVNLFAKLTSNDPRNPESWYYYGVTLGSIGRLNEALRAFDNSIQLDPDYSNSYYAAYYMLNEVHQVERAVHYLELWLERHPQDSRTRELLDSMRPQAQGQTGQPLMPRPTAPSLP